VIIRASPCGPGYTLNLLPKETAAIPDAFDQARQTLAALQDYPAQRFQNAFISPSLWPATRRFAQPGRLSFVCIPAFWGSPVGEFCLDDYFLSQRVKRIWIYLK